MRVISAVVASIARASDAEACDAEASSSTPECVCVVVWANSLHGEMAGNRGHSKSSNVAAPARRMLASAIERARRTGVSTASLSSARAMTTGALRGRGTMMHATSVGRGRASASRRTLAAQAQFAQRGGSYTPAGPR